MRNLKKNLPGRRICGVPRYRFNSSISSLFAILHRMFLKLCPLLLITLCSRMPYDLPNCLHKFTHKIFTFSRLRLLFPFKFRKLSVRCFGDCFTLCERDVATGNGKHVGAIMFTLLDWSERWCVSGSHSR